MFYDADKIGYDYSGYPYLLVSGEEIMNVRNVTIDLGPVRIVITPDGEVKTLVRGAGPQFAHSNDALPPDQVTVALLVAKKILDGKTAGKSAVPVPAPIPIMAPK